MLMTLGFVKLVGMAGFVAALLLFALGMLGAAIALLVGLVKKKRGRTLFFSLVPSSFIAAVGLLWALAIENWWWAGVIRDHADEAAPFIVLAVLGTAVGLHFLTRTPR